MTKRNFVMLFTTIAIVEVVGIIGSMFTIAALPTWYAALEKPMLNPPNWVFGPVWTVLYVLMGIALFLVWRKGTMEHGAQRAISVFALQLALNVAWSYVFFTLQSPWYALVTIVLLWIAIVWTIAEFRKITPTAAWLLVPYILWVSFAAYLNYAIWMLN